MNYTPELLIDILDVKASTVTSGMPFREVAIDSRKVNNPIATIFFAIPGKLDDGHHYISDLYQQGVRNFVISAEIHSDLYPAANFFRVHDVVRALQQLARHHLTLCPALRKIAITGSNGKTIIKEWLYQMLFDEFSIVKSPKSYNSQIGLSLSVLAAEQSHDLGIFEAGISEPNEMSIHAEILNPEIGLISNIGSAHDAGFKNRNQKLEEKLMLFRNSKTIVYQKDNATIHQKIQSLYPSKNLFTWGSAGADVNIIFDKKSNDTISVEYDGQKVRLKIKHIDKASKQNIAHCIALSLFLGVKLSTLQKKINRISGLTMRLELSRGIQNSLLFNDAYSADIDALQVALEFMVQQSSGMEKMAILSPFEQSGMDEQKAFQHIVHLLQQYHITELIYISPGDVNITHDSINIQKFGNKNKFLNALADIHLRNKAILIKGSRGQRMEEIVTRLSQSSHSAQLTLDLTALEHNIRVYKSFLKNETEIIGVIKASAYGSGAAEIGRVLQHNNIKHLAVAFVDEGIELRKAGIDVPIIIFNPDDNDLDLMHRYNLDIEVYDYKQISKIAQHCKETDTEMNIHINVDTGMHRLGFFEGDFDNLIQLLQNNPRIIVKSIFTHLASSEDPDDDQYTKQQASRFETYYKQISATIPTAPKKHILNSGGISRFPEYQYDMVRLGLGMYGIDNNPKIKNRLQKVHGLHANLLQIKAMKKGDSIGYNRKTILERDCTIGVVNIGYADGLLRSLSNRKYHLLMRGKPVDIVGNICMDLTMIDLSTIENPFVGEMVSVFDSKHTIEKMAKAAGTIPYEIMSRISTRVKRKFIRN